FRELAALYGADGDAGALPDLPLQYADYAVWQRSWLEEGSMAASLEVLRARLQGVPQLDLPTDRPRPRHASPAGAVLSQTLPKGLRERVDALALEVGTTPFVVLLSAFD